MTLSELRATLVWLKVGERATITPEQFVALFPGGQKGDRARTVACNAFARDLGCRVEDASEKHLISFIKVSGTR